MRAIHFKQLWKGFITVSTVITSKAEPLLAATFIY